MTTEAVNNPIEGDLFNNLHRDTEVQTTASNKLNPQQACIGKLLHPPSAIPSYEGLPTNDARSQVCVEWRNMELMKTPRVFNMTEVGSPVVALNAEDLATFEYAILSTSGARVINIPFIYNFTNQKMTQDVGNVMIQDLYNWENWAADANIYRMAYKSATYYLNATAFNNTGMVSGNQFNPNILFAGTILSFAHNHPEYFYSFVKDGFDSGRYSRISKPQRDESANWECLPSYHRSEIVRTLGLMANEIVNLDPNTSIQVVSFGRLNFDEYVPTDSQILANSMRSYGGKALEGCFSVQRLNTITPAWCSATNTSTATDDQNGLYECYYHCIEAGTTHRFLPFKSNTAVNVLFNDSKTLMDTLWTKDMTWSWTRFSGLSLNAQTSVSAQLLIKKIYTGLEIQPNPASAWSGMMRLGPKPNIATLQATMDAFYELKDAMPARYNFQGLAAIASNVLPSLMESTSPKSDKKGRKQGGRPSRTRNVSAKIPIQKDIANIEKDIGKLAIDEAKVGRSSRSASRVRSLSRQRSTSRVVSDNTRKITRTNRVHIRGSGKRNNRAGARRTTGTAKRLIIKPRGNGKIEYEIPKNGNKRRRKLGNRGRPAFSDENIEAWGRDMQK